MFSRTEGLKQSSTQKILCSKFIQPHEETDLQSNILDNLNDSITDLDFDTRQKVFEEVII